MSYNIESGFISKLLQTKDIATVKDNQITLEYFTGENKSAFHFIQESVISNGEVPTVRVFKRKFPKYKFETIETEDGLEVGTEENLKFWCDELRKKKKHNSLADSVMKTASLLQDFETTEAYNEMKRIIAYIETEVTETSDVDVTKNTEDRVKAYLDRKENRGMRGLPTGFTHLDNLLKGLEKETLTVLIAQTGIGKALTYKTPVLTESGFKPMEDIKVGEKVCARDGNFYPVTAIYPQGYLPVFRVTFEDGSYVDCNEEHLWVFKTSDDLYRNNDWRVKTLKQLISDHPLRRDRGYNLSIPVQSKVNFKGNSELPIHPYVLGCLLGDGGFTTDRVSFSSAYPDHVEYVNSLLSDLGEFTSTTDNNYSYNFVGKNPRHNSLFRAIKRLGLHGLKSYEKFIPTIYLTASVSDRLELVRGLVDTDGTVTKKGNVVFFSSSKFLQEGFAYLIRSLGIRCYLKEYNREGRRTEYKVFVSAKDPTLFKSNQRKKQWINRKKFSKKNRYDVLKIVNIEKLGYFEKMKCITVDSPDHTFICGDFIVTHNTWLQVIMGAYCQMQNCRVLQFVTEMSEEIMRDRYEAILFAKYHGELNYSKLKSGTLDPETERYFLDFLEKDLPTFEPLYIATATGVMGVASSIEKYKPDIVFIDSAYLMEDDQGAKDDWLRVAHITRDLKKLAKRAKVPIFINTQADKNSSRKTGPELGSIMYTQAIGQDADNVLALYRDEVMINDREMGIKILKQREGTLGKVVVNWDFETMNFSDIYIEEEGGDSSTNTISVDD